MRLFHSLLQASIIALSATPALAASWTFTDATVSVQSKGTGVGGSQKERYAARPTLTISLTDEQQFESRKATSKGYYSWT